MTSREYPGASFATFTANFLHLETAYAIATPFKMLSNMHKKNTTNREKLYEPIVVASW